MKTSLVTGTTGSIGAHLAKFLIERGDYVVGIVHDKHPESRNVLKLLDIEKDLHIVYGDITDPVFVKRAVIDMEVENIYHLAALPIVRVGNVSPVPIFDVNINGTVNIMEAAKDANASVLYMSTDKVYGHHGNVPYKEDFALNGLNIYEASKACADLIVRSYNYVYGVPIVISRSCNIYGPSDLNSRLIPNTIKNCLMNSPPLIFDGVGYTREWIYVEDVVKALAGLMANMPKTNGQCYNIGTGFSASQEQVIGEILKYFPTIKPKIIPPPKYTKKEIPYQTLNSEKIRKEIGWSPKISFEEGIKITVDWWKANKSLLLTKVQQANTRKQAQAQQ